MEEKRMASTAGETKSRPSDQFPSLASRMERGPSLLDGECTFCRSPGEEIRASF
jgi:hypothetical protein